MTSETTPVAGAVATTEPKDTNVKTLTKPKKKSSSPKATAPKTEKKVAAKPKAPKQEGKTFSDACAGYLRSMDDEGCSETTISSYRFELKAAAEALGEDTKLADITPKKVLNYFESDRVTKKRNGKAKSQLSIDKSRRAVNQALEWAESVGMVENAPIPETVST